jgi:hypothetical protein
MLDLAGVKSEPPQTPPDVASMPPMRQLSATVITAPPPPPPVDSKPLAPHALVVSPTVAAQFNDAVRRTIAGDLVRDDDDGRFRLWREMSLTCCRDVAYGGDDAAVPVE